MKLTSKILLTFLLLFIAGLFVSNAVIKREYERVDKGDLYWNYAVVLQQPFRHIRINGGNVTRIVYEQNAKPSVRVLKFWQGYSAGTLKPYVKNDTLYLEFPNVTNNPNERDWMKYQAMVRVFSPELLSVTGSDTRFEMLGVKQPDFNVVLTGRSTFEMESMQTEFNSLKIAQQDSSEVIFEMSPDYRASSSFHVKRVEAKVTGVSLLDLGHAQIDSIKLDVADSSGVMLSGGTMKKRF